MRVFFLLLSLLLTIKSAHAIQNQSFEAWSLLCGKQGNCSLSQLVSLDPKGDKVLAGINVNYSVSSDFPVLMVRLPPAANLKAGLGIKVDDNKAIQLPLSQCNASACQSVIKIDKQLLSELQSGKVALFAISVGEDKRQLTLPVSLAGFNKGFQALVNKMTK